MPVLVTKLYQNQNLDFLAKTKIAENMNHIIVIDQRSASNRRQGGHR
ncbi:unnamed protein product [Acidithrix sp. C25]|nr:unnamed protein product [Acidithrix sp. C25]